MVWLFMWLPVLAQAATPTLSIASVSLAEEKNWHQHHDLHHHPKRQQRIDNQCDLRYYRRLTSFDLRKTTMRLNFAGQRKLWSVPYFLYSIPDPSSTQRNQ
jgi:hypothetical protein